MHLTFLHLMQSNMSNPMVINHSIDPSSQQTIRNLSIRIRNHLQFNR